MRCECGARGLSAGSASIDEGSLMDQVMSQLGSQLFWILVIVVAGLMGAGIFRMNHRGNRTRMQALLGKPEPKEASPSERKRPKPRPKKKR